MSKALDKFQRLQIADASDGLTVGETNGRCPCPFCGGGVSRDQSFSVGVGKDGVTWYKCWRLKCGEAGVIDGPPRPAKSSYSPQEEVVRERLLAQSNDNRVLGIWGKHQNTSPEYFPILKFNGDLKGMQWRSPVIPGRATFMLSTEKVVGGFFRRAAGVTTNYPLIVVEDPISARAVSEFTDSYCLFGTDFSEDKLDEIVSSVSELRTLWLCLDRDATVKAAQYVIDYRLRAPQLRLMPIHRDLKHWNKNDLEEFICG